VQLQVGLDIEGGSVTNGHEADFVRGVQGVENEFTEKDCLGLIEGVDDNVHKSGNFDLELCVQRSEDMGGKEKKLEEKKCKGTLGDVRKRSKMEERGSLAVKRP
jgi:hypothetical protein